MSYGTCMAVNISMIQLNLRSAFVCISEFRQHRICQLGDVQEMFGSSCGACLVLRQVEGGFSCPQPYFASIVEPRWLDEV